MAESICSLMVRKYLPEKEHSCNYIFVMPLTYFLVVVTCTTSVVTQRISDNIP